MTRAAASDPATGGPDTSPLLDADSSRLSDDRLARRATKGDRRAFEAIYKRYHRDLYRFCLAMVGNPQDAQDALQNTMVKVLRALPGEKRHIQLKPWLYRIARNEAVETVRRRRDSVEIEPEHAVSMEGVAETAETRERLRKLIADLEELPDRQRAALVMRELADLGFAQIGEAFETSAAVARQTVYEARLSLRQMEEGREMSCDRVMRELSDADGRVTRRREVRAHLRACPSCRAFRDSMATRRGELAAIAPLPLAVSAGLLHGILSGKASAAGLSGSAAGAVGGGGGLAGAVGAGAGKAVATSAILKAAATVAVVAAVGAGAADRSGLIHVPLLDGSGKPSQSSSQPAGSGGSAGGAATQQAESATENGGGGKGGDASGRGTKAAGSRHAASGGHGRAGAAGHAASGRAHSHGRGSNAGAGSKGSSASAHVKATAAAHGHATRKSQRSSSGHHATSHSRHSSRGNRTSHRHRSPPRHPHHSSAAAAPTKPPPPKKKESAPNPPPASGETPSAGASSTTEPPAGG